MRFILRHFCSLICFEIIFHFFLYWKILYLISIQCDCIWVECSLFNSNALTKIKSIILVVVIVVAAVGGVVAYVIITDQDQSSEIIKIGIPTNRDDIWGRSTWQGAVLAAEQINAEGGILGKKVKLINEAPGGGFDMAVVNSAMNRLITYHEVDFIVGECAGEAGFVVQDIAAEHKKIFVGLSANQDEITQRVLDDYETYKYYFRER